MSENMEYMGSIAKSIFHSERLNGVDWESISVVFEIDEKGEVNGIYGYAYDHGGAYTARAPRIREVSQPVEEYREWLRLEGDKGFIKMLFQFNKITRQVNAKFEFEDPLRWQITPKNVDEMIEALRPNFDD